MDEVAFDVTNHSRPVRFMGEDGPVETTEEIWLIEAGNARGDRWVHVGTFQTEEAARKHLSLAQAEPLDGDTWHPTEPVYGSPAWGPENEYALACFEADCYGEPRPTWI